MILSFNYNHPAYAGKSSGLLGINCGHQNHPRVCGEKLQERALERQREGSPPRMRGKVQVRVVLVRVEGITPAYAGKRRHHMLRRLAAEDHPRVCGEKGGAAAWRRRLTGSPPRMRGKVVCSAKSAISLRITPAYAGKSYHHGRCYGAQEDHPRVCGEKIRKLEK